MPDRRESAGIEAVGPTMIPVSARGNLWGLLAIALKHEAELGALSVDERERLVAQYASIKTRGDAARAILRVSELIRAKREEQKAAWRLLHGQR